VWLRCGCRDGDPSRSEEQNILQTKHVFASPYRAAGVGVGSVVPRGCGGLFVACDSLWGDSSSVEF